MPTGTGKTGVMAVLATRRAASAPVLVVCPSAALVEQLMSEFGTRFWDTIGAAPDWRPDMVLQALPGSVQQLGNQLRASADQRIIVVATIQAVQQIHSVGDIGCLKGSIGTIIFDEGHREPAPLWAAVVREFNVPTVLFSATPFRGDLKVFNVDDAHIHFLSFEDAVAKALIRGIDVQVMGLSEDATVFAGQVIAESDRLISARELDPGHKVIVRAGSEDAVIDLYHAFVHALAARTDGVIALHHNFTLAGGEGAQQRPDVPPNLRQRSERFLIHQFMLVEGIDDPKCSVLALYEPFGNTRMLSAADRPTHAAVGTIRSKMSDARVLTRALDGMDRDWRSFLDYDKASHCRRGEPPLRNGDEVLRSLVSALPQMDYVSGKFRTRIDLDDADLSEDLRFPRVALVYDVSDQFSIDKFQAAVSAALDAEDRFQHQTRSIPGGACRYHVTLRLNQSPFLAEYLFQAASLEVTIYT